VVCGVHGLNVTYLNLIFYKKVIKTTKTSEQPVFQPRSKKLVPPEYK